MSKTLAQHIADDICFDKDIICSVDENSGYHSQVEIDWLSLVDVIKKSLEDWKENEE